MMMMMTNLEPARHLSSKTLTQGAKSLRILTKGTNVNVASESQKRAGKYFEWDEE